MIYFLKCNEWFLRRFFDCCIFPLGEDRDLEVVVDVKTKSGGLVRLDMTRGYGNKIVYARGA